MDTQTNKVQLTGHLGKKPEIRTFEGGKKMARFSIATNESYKNAKGDMVKETHWHNLVAWGKTAELAEKNLDKGTEVAIEGRLANRSYTNKEGEKKFITEVVVFELELPGGKGKSESAEAAVMK